MRLAEDLTRAIKTQDVELSHFDRGCAKTRAFNLRVESSSQFGQSENQKCWRRLSEEGNRENSSTLSWLAHVFTRPGSILAAGSRPRERPESGAQEPWQWLVRQAARDVAEGAARRLADAQREAETVALALD